MRANVKKIYAVRVKRWDILPMCKIAKNDTYTSQCQGYRVTGGLEGPWEQIGFVQMNNTKEPDTLVGFTRSKV